MKELVSFKGSTDGLKLILSPNVKSFAEIEPKVIQKLRFTPDFFQPNTKLLLEKCSLPLAEQIELSKLFEQYNLKLVIKSSVVRGINKNLKNIKHEEKNTEDLVLCKTIRGGEEISHPGNVIIYGNVNPSAKIIAQGNIDIHGTCNGIVWAGCPANRHATITADELNPSQIKIANVIAISPENVESPSKPMTEQAIIKDGKIIFQTYRRN